MGDVVEDAHPTPSGVLRVSALRSVPFPAEWYDALGLADHFWSQWRLRAFLAQCVRIGLSRQESLQVLDVGGGSGVLRRQLESVTRWVVDVTDLSLAALEQAPEGRGRKLYYDIQEERAIFLGVYDVVVLFDVLEHVAEPRAFLHSLLRHLKPGGLLAVNVPALPFLMSAYDRAVGHLRRYTAGSLKQALAGLDASPLEVSYWGLSLVPVLAARTLLTPRGCDPERVIRFGFRPPGPWTHRALRALMRLETALLPRCPLGSSLLLAARRHPL